MCDAKVKYETELQSYIQHYVTASTITYIRLTWKRRCRKERFKHHPPILPDYDFEGPYKCPSKGHIGLSTSSFLGKCTKHRVIHFRIGEIKTQSAENNFVLQIGINYER